MLSQLTIPKDPAADPALDWQKLYALGLNRVQELASRTWTDYNVHDPGVTILELLCYALTDLSYRAGFPVEDLLAVPEDNAEKMKDHFFTAREILPNRPLTGRDYRKLLIDIKGVKNAWLRAAKQSLYADPIEGKLLRENPGTPGIRQVSLGGLYDVTIEYEDDVTSAEEKAQVMSAAKQRLLANRNLCEDFENFAEVEAQNFLICAELEVAPDAELAKVQAAVIFQVQQYLAPSVPNYTLREMLARKKRDGTPFTVDEIFEGPALDCGFIDDEELRRASLRTEILLSDVISVIMDVEGVRAVRDIVINPEGVSVPLEEKWTIPIAETKKALLNQEKSRLVFYKRGMPVAPDAVKVQGYLAELISAARLRTEAVVRDDLAIPAGNYRKVGDYYSLQNHFPAIYGLSEAGLSAGADGQRKALAFQLKAYLLFFDQILANSFAQLAHLKELFSTDPNLRQTYFGQAVDSFAEYERIYAGDPLPILEGVLEEQDTFVDRRNRFLDHLISRFAEGFAELAHVLSSAFGLNPEKMIAYKCDFLRNYPAVSGERSLAYNYAVQNGAELWDSQNVSGLEKRLAKLLGLPNVARRNLSAVAHDSFATVEETGGQFAFRFRDRETGATLFAGAGNFASADLARVALGHAIFRGLLPSGYRKTTAPGGKFTFEIADNQGVALATSAQDFATETLRDLAIDNLISYLQANCSDEGFFLIEMILLTPKSPLDPLLPICADPNCTDCAEEDPYSFRLHVILPAYSSRFSNMDFRRFAEEVIREEVPAHILPRICWISRDEMAVLEKAYRDWISLEAGADETDSAAKLQAFSDILFAVRSVYPSQKLRACDAGEEQTKFVLGQTALGTFNAQT